MSFPSRYVQPDKIDLRVVLMDSPSLEHQPQHIFYFFKFKLEFPIGVQRSDAPNTKIPQISLRFLSIILRVLRFEVSVYNVYITNQFQTTFAQGRGGGVKSVSRGDCE
jgi:hypothetical protein